LEHSTSVLSPKHVTMAEALAAAGYDTIAFSANPAFVTPRLGLAQGFDSFVVLHGAPEARKRDDAPTAAAFRKAPEPGTPADKVTNAVLAWLARRRGNAPFFAYVHYFDPHSDYDPPAAYAHRFGVDPASPIAAGQDALFRRPGALTPEELATLVALYDAEIAFTDTEIGRLLDGLAAQTRTPTLVVVTSDHGEEFNEHGGLQHGGTLYEEQLRVPLIFAHAGMAAGAVVDDAVSLVDLWPTIAARVGLRHPLTIAGRSGRNVLETRERGLEPTFADLARREEAHAVVVDPWKLIVSKAGTGGLYDLDRDPGERRDLAAADTARATLLQTALATRNATAAPVRAALPPASVRLSGRQRAQLQALGYLE
jgi:arylsulfatase A-like enzyme